MLHNQHTEQSNGHPQEPADYQGPDVFVTKQSQTVDTFPLMVRVFQGCNFQGCGGVLYLKIWFGTQRAC
eukprot:15367042-Ditylum_brightwellii.AAC.1